MRPSALPGCMLKVRWTQRLPASPTICSILALIFAPYPRLRMVAAQVARLEAEIDVMNAKLTPLRSFILPGGSALAAQLHLCRTVCRRAERLTVDLAAHEDVNPEAVKYLNRLSDWFFVAGRIANNDGADDVLWVPGLTRE
jgi:cob(I)alamin adenosyltransferase